MHKSLLIIVALLVVMSGSLFIGCDNNNNQPIIPETGNQVTSIEIRAQHTLISGLRGEERTEQITAIARNASGVGVSGVSLRFGIRDPQNYKGTITVAASDSVTDQNGQIIANYSVVLEQDVDVVITTKVGQISAEKTMQLRVREESGNLSVEVTKGVLTVPPGQTRNTQVTATLVDSEGLALPGVQVRFSTNPATMGFVDSDTGMTDNSGRAIRTFTSIVNQYGKCDVISKVGETTEAKSTIEIRNVAGPRFILIDLQPPNLFVEQGENAQSIVKAVVTDSTGVGVPGTAVLFEIASLGDDPIFGSLTSVGDTTTNMDGEISTTFNSRGGFGQEWIIARVIPSQETEGSPDLSTRAIISVDPLTDAPRSMTLSATPSLFNIPPDSTGKAIISAKIRDQNRNGIPNLTVNFSADMGTLARPTATDSSGTATTEFYILPLSDIEDFEETAIARVTATIPGTGWTSTVEITITVTEVGEGTLTIQTDIKHIWADGPGLSFAKITAILQDADGQSLSNQPIVFTSSFPSSVVQSPMNTDSLGRAMTVFDDAGLPSINPETGMPDSVLITARYDPMGLASSLRIMIGERNPVSLINFGVQARQLVASSGDSTSARATCILSDGSAAPEGTTVNFEARYGSFSERTVHVTGSSGAADTWYIAGRMVTTDTLWAYVKTTQDSVVSNLVLIDLVSGPPAIMVLGAEPWELVTNDPTSVSIVTATVMDTSGNPVRQGTLVNFSSLLGTITPSAITDIDGDAKVRLTPGTQAGVTEITATVNTGTGQITATTTVTFISGTPNQIQLTADPLQIQVKGTGGISTSTLRATVKDPNGNLVENPVSVVFELINEPPPDAGCTLGERDQVFVTQTSNGVAVASLNAGTQIGGKLIRAYTWPDSADEPERIVEVILQTVAVVAGPPFQLDIDVNDEGTDAGGGAWVIEVSARVWDIHRNPVADRIPVVFTVDPEIANIAPGYTGNDGVSGNATQGLAYAALIYNSINTFDPINISAEITTP